MKKLLIIIFLFALCSGLCAESNYEERANKEINNGKYNAKVINVYDGDTITVSPAGRSVSGYHRFGRTNISKVMHITNLVTSIKMKIRLYGIDCPELNQPYGKDAKQFLLKLVKNTLLIVAHNKNCDKSKRQISKVIIFSKRISLNVISPRTRFKDLSKELIKRGLAWVYPKHFTMLADSRWAGSDKTLQKWEKLQAEAKKKKIGLWKDKNPIPPWEWRKRKKK